jgi:hypothetical protein
MPRTYESKPAAPGATGEESISTEGYTFTLDAVTFTCHGEMDANDLVELAPLMDAGEGDWLDPASLAAIGHFYRAVLGPVTYRQFSAHRRQHRTAPSVVAQIMFDLIEEVTAGPPAVPSPSQAGPPPTGPSSAGGSPSPERLFRLPPAAGADPEGIIPREMLADADVVLAPAPAGPPAQDAAGGMVRVVNLGRPGVQMREPDEAERAAMAAAAS